MSELIERARALRATIEGLAVNLDDESAVENVELFPQWADDATYVAGDRVRYNGELYRVLQNHSAQSDWAPDVAAALFARVLPGQDGTEIGVWEQPDSTNGYMTGDRVHYPDADGPVYESLLDNNVWAPTFAQGWQIVE